MSMAPARTSDKSWPTQRVRPPSQAGLFYEAEPSNLKKMVEGFLSRHVSLPSCDSIAALIVPHAGHRFSGNVAAAGFAALRRDHPYHRVFLIGPSHYEWLDGASVDTAFAAYSTPLGKVPLDRGVARSLLEADDVFCYREAAHDREHCLEVQLPFLQVAMSHLPAIVPIIVSTNRLDRLQRIADALRPYFTPDNLFVISSDFSHYPSYADACKVDSRSREALLTGDVGRWMDVLRQNALGGTLRLETSACGEYAITVLLMMLDSQYAVRHLLYQNSGDVEGGDKRRVVGYHAFAVMRKAAFSLTEGEKRTLHQIARNSIDSVFGGRGNSSYSVTPALRTPCGVFVTLRRKGELRGCIGHIGEDTPLFRLVGEMAQAAAFADRRFPPLRREEWDDVEIEISVLTPRRRIYSLDEFQLHRHGLLIRKGDRSGTFLPQVAEEVNWTKEEFVGHCSQDKAGLGWDGWRDAELYTYEAIVF